MSTRRKCELLSINRSTLYYKPEPFDEEARILDEKLMERIDYWHTVMPYLGSRRLVKKLKEDGYEVCRKKVRTLMQKMCITALYPKANLSKRNFKEAIVPYLLRNYIVCRPNQVWSIDITYIKMAHGHMYLTAIIDWYSRKIVGWTLADGLDTEYCINTVQAAIIKYGKPEIINSDQGSQFTNPKYKAMLKEAGIRQSMDGKSRWADNIMIERWFRSLKTEKIYIEEFSSPRELHAGIKTYIHDYNTIRPHEALDYAYPDDVFFRRYAA